MKSKKLQNVQEAILNLEDALCELEADGASRTDTQPYRDRLEVERANLQRLEKKS